MDRLAGLTNAIAGKPETVADRISAVLRKAIVAGALPAGSALRQDELAARFGFSRMPVRDALRQLETEGLVSIHPTKGAFVAAMDPTEIREIFALRELLEVEALRLSCPRLDDDILSKASAALDRIDGEPNVARWGALNAAFHLALYGRCGNSRLLAAIEAYHGAVDRYVRVLLSNLDYQSRSQQEHRNLLAACFDRDERRAASILRAHLRTGSDMLSEAVRGRMGC